MNASQIALNALRQKFPTGIPDVHSLSDEQKAWLQMKIQTLAEASEQSDMIVSLQRIRNRFVHATEDIPDKEFQKMVSFVFENMGEIEKLVKD